VAGGHGREEIASAVAHQLRTLDYAPAFQSSHPLAFEAAERLSEFLPDGLDRIFFTNSGYESADTALKIALAYHRVTGNPLRNKLIGRERGYHGVNFGGVSVGGIAGNRKSFGNGLAGIDHLRHPLHINQNAFTHGLPAEGGIALANEFETRINTLHDPSTIAALSRNNGERHHTDIHQFALAKPAQCPFAEEVEKRLDFEVGRGTL
jgi:beta-alanine--pyruvate transaminase